MGKILQGQLLREKDFEGPTSVVSDPCPAAFDGQTLHDNPIPPSHSDMGCDAQEDPGPSVFHRSHKRGLETAGISEADLELPQKCLRTNRQ
jgi:hypothetical protein